MKKRILIVAIINILLFGFKADAQYILKQADEQYNLFNYSKAVDLYQKAYKKKPGLYTVGRLGSCYQSLRNYSEAEKWYALAVVMSKNSPEYVLDYADALKNNSKYQEAKERYIQYRATLEKGEFPELIVKLQSCDSAMKWLKKPLKIKLSNLTALNSVKSDWGGGFYKNSLVFTSDREFNPLKDSLKKRKPFLKFDGDKVPDKDIYGWTGNNYLRLYQLDENNLGTAKVSPFPFSFGAAYHLASATFTGDGNVMYFTVTKLFPAHKNKRGIETINMEIYSSEKDTVTNTWGKPIPFKYDNQSRWSVGDPFISSDGKCLYFVSDMPGGKGGTDIYNCIKDTANNWGPAINVEAVNSPGNERTPMLAANGNFYFSSDGAIGMGGLDIFEALHQGNTYTDIHNMHYPVNSPQDDFGLTVTADNKFYLSSDRFGGIGSDDIYSFVFEKPVKVIKLRGVCYDKQTNAALPGAKITLVNSEQVQTISDDKGRYSFDLEDHVNYSLVSEKINYSTDHKTLTTIGLNNIDTISLDIYLEKVVEKAAGDMTLVNYDFDSSKLKGSAVAQLGKIIEKLQGNSRLKIEVASHTDSRGTDKYNLLLSKRRSEAVVEFLTAVGKINKNRILASWYGETRLVNQCINGTQCTEAEHRVNRRSEIYFSEK